MNMYWGDFMKRQSRCLGCMEIKAAEGVCPKCGWLEEVSPESTLFLPPGTVLEEKFLIGRVLGQGGFGITYLAWDMNLDIKLAIKEYLPQEMAYRTENSKEVSIFKKSFADYFEYGLEKFLEEARTLARFSDNPNIVKVRDFFRANGTAYLVMDYLEGVTLKEYLQSKDEPLPFDQAISIFMPVLDALKEVHSAGILHRDISPDNLLINTNGRVVLIDFGAARQAMGERSRSMSVIMKAGYSPEEQYRSRGQQGPWTDVYAVAATIYRAITGEMPPESLDRLAEDTLVPPSKLGVDIGPVHEEALLKALSVKGENRFQRMEDFLQAMLGQRVVASNDEKGEPIKSRAHKEELKEDTEKVKEKTKNKTIYIGIAAALIIVGVFSVLIFASLDDETAGREPEEAGDDAGIAENTVSPPADDTDITENEEIQLTEIEPIVTDQEVVISSKEFTEQIILGNIALIALEYYGIPTVDKIGLGGTVAVREAQLTGDVDLYWEYTGTALISHLGYNEVKTDPHDCYLLVKEEDLQRNDLIWLDYTSFNNTYTIMMRRSDSDALGIESLSELAHAINEDLEVPEPGNWIFATDHEYAVRPDGYASLQQHYGFAFDEVVTMDLGHTYAALRDGDVATAMGFATDSRIAAYDLVNLKDDLKFHPVYNCAPVVRKEILEVLPEIKDILNPIARSLDEKVMSELNMKVDLYNELPSSVAEEWLFESGFIQ